MIAELEKRCATDFTPPPDESIWQWAERCVDFSRATNYDCADLVGPYRSNVAPYTRGIMDAAQDSTVRRIIVKKCSRACVSEAVLMILRHAVECKPRPTYYMTADQQLSEAFMDRRIKRGMKLSRKLWRRFQSARVTEHEIQFDQMDLRVSWPRAKGAFKQDGWSLIVADEASTWEQFSLDMLYKRAGTYAFHTIIVLSSLDPTRNRGKNSRSVRDSVDPVVQEYNSTDQRQWFMPDPKKKRATFKWEFGGPTDPFGIKWPTDAKDPTTGDWDLARVEREAYYLTPSGTKIRNKDRLKVSAAGAWKSTADSMEHLVGFEIVAPMVPFNDGDFGTLAVRFLLAKKSGYNALRTYFMENWARDYTGEVDKIEDVSLQTCRAQYYLGTIASTLEALRHDGARRVIMTIDVQKDHFWYLVREWFLPGHSYLMDYSRRQELKTLGSTCNTWEQLRDVRNKYNANYVFIDNRYPQRQDEVIAQCAAGIMRGTIPVYGHDKLRDRFGRPTKVVTYENKDPYEGRKHQGEFELTWVSVTPDPFKDTLFELMNGLAPQSWKLPSDVGEDYTEQLTCWEKVDGTWIATSRNDHLGDCEAMQVCAAHLVQVLIENVGTLPETAPQKEKEPDHGKQDNAAKSKRKVIRHEW